MVLGGFVTAWRLAGWPASRSPVLVKATTDGTVRPPSAEGITVGSPPSMTATTELVVPRSMPMILPMALISSLSSTSGCVQSMWVRVPGSVVAVWFGIGPVGGAPWARIAIARSDGDERGSEHTVPDPVAALDFRHDLAVCPA